MLLIESLCNFIDVREITKTFKFFDQEKSSRCTCLLGSTVFTSALTVFTFAITYSDHQSSGLSRVRFDFTSIYVKTRQGQHLFTLPARSRRWKSYAVWSPKSFPIFFPCLSDSSLAEPFVLKWHPNAVPRRKCDCFTSERGRKSQRIVLVEVSCRQDWSTSFPHGREVCNEESLSQ